MNDGDGKPLSSVAPDGWILGADGTVRASHDPASSALVCDPATGNVWVGVAKGSGAAWTRTPVSELRPVSAPGLCLCRGAVGLRVAPADGSLGQRWVVGG